MRQLWQGKADEANGLSRPIALDIPHIAWSFLCRSGVVISGAITVGLWKIFGVVANKVSVDFAVRRVTILLYVH